MDESTLRCTIQAMVIEHDEVATSPPSSVDRRIDGAREVMARYTHGDIHHRNSRDDVDEELSLEGGRAEWWYTVESEEGEETVYSHDYLVLAAILRSVPSDMSIDL